ncbi:hypothetical protein LCGC14_1875690 [marine sediment metagenome]|uniref:Uncharacterized protein n=1 Tax=marine sediment metagenome TaxID=412755 RepID=A0A0F9J2G5_9ZZZZ
MKAKTKVTLEEAMESWMEKQCEQDHWALSIGDSLIPEDLSEKMAEAAGAVFDINISGQAFAKEKVV